VPAERFWAMDDFRIKIFPRPGGGLPSVLTIILLVVLVILDPEGMADAFKTSISTLFDILVNIVKAIFGVD
jgi:hypothetical protein